MEQRKQKKEKGTEKKRSSDQPNRKDEPQEKRLKLGGNDVRPSTKPYVEWADRKKATKAALNAASSRPEMKKSSSRLPQEEAEARLKEGEGQSSHVLRPDKDASKKPLLEKSVGSGPKKPEGKSIKDQGTSSAVPPEKKRKERIRGDRVSVCLPHHQVMMQSVSPDISVSDAAPAETCEYALGLFDRFAPKFLQDELKSMPMEPIAHRLVRDLLVCGVRAATLVDKIKDVVALEHGEAPKSLVDAWKAEKDKLTKEKDALEEEKKILIAEKAKLEKEKKKLTDVQNEQQEIVKGLQRQVKEHKSSLSKNNAEVKNLREENKTLRATIEGIPARESSLLQEFLRSGAFRSAALATAQPALRDAMYAILVRLGMEYPFEPEELGFAENDGGKIPDFSSFNWDRARDALINSEGQVLVPPPALPDLENLKLKHPWEGDWPSSEDEEVPLEIEHAEEALEVAKETEVLEGNLEVPEGDRQIPTVDEAVTAPEVVSGDVPKTP